LSYEASQERDICLRVAAENCKDTLPTQGKLTNTNYLQCGPEKIPDFTPIQGSTAYNEKSTFINIPLPYDPNVPTIVATTCSLLTSAKLSDGYLVVGITRELDKEPLLH